MIELLLQADRLLTVDMVDQADAIYRRVAESDPGNAIAVVGLARCALARADDHAAYRLAADALAIDPQNEMARRMEARLHEVLTLRGETPGAGPGAATVASGAETPVAATTPPATPPREPVAAPPAVEPPAAPPVAAAAPRAVAAPVAAPEAAPPVAAAAPPPAPPAAPPAGRRSFLDRIRGR
ncbi:MAG: hypothetical protein ACKOTZ_06430 [Chloroflexota bacterium]